MDDDISDQMNPKMKMKSMDTSRTTFLPSENKNNAVTEKLFIGSFYVGSNSTSAGNVCSSTSKWRVQL